MDWKNDPSYTFTPPNIRVFQINSKNWGRVTPSEVESEIMQGGGIFLLGGGNLRRNDFDNPNLFQSKKQLSVNADHQLKSKFALPVCPKKSMKLKQKCYIGGGDFFSRCRRIPPPPPAGKNLNIGVKHKLMFCA